jgi:hypothetical protein
VECKDTAYRAISPDGLKGFPLEGKHPKVDPLGSEGNLQGKKKAKDIGKERLGKALKIPCARKFIFVRIEISLRAHAIFSLCGRKQIFFRRAIPFLAGRAPTSSKRNFPFPSKNAHSSAEAGRNEKLLA